MRQALDEGKIVIVAGFQGIDENYNITTLGRGGSDTTAVALAAVMKHDPAPEADGDVGCEIYTDVDGVYTTDPRIVPEARKIDVISYDEMLELASVGAGVMHSRSIEFAKKFDVPLQVRSSFSDAEGTWIVPEADWMRDVAVCGAAMVKDEARVSLDGVPDRARRQPSRLLRHRRAEHRRGHDRPERRQRRQGQRSASRCCGNELPADAGRAAAAGRRAGRHASSTRRRSARCRSSAPACGRTPAWPSGCSPPWPAENVNMKMITTGDIKISVLVGHGRRRQGAAGGAPGVRPRRAAARRRLPAAATRQQFQPSPRRPPAREPTAATWPHLTQQLSSMEDIVVSDVLLDTDQGRITIFDLPDRPGNCSRVFQAVAAGGIVVDMIVQNLAGRPGRAVVQRAAGRPRPGAAT